MESINNNHLLNTKVNLFLDEFQDLLSKNILKINIDFVLDHEADSLEELSEQINNGEIIPKFKIKICNYLNLNDIIIIKQNYCKRRRIEPVVYNDIYLNKIYQYYFITNYIIWDKYYKNILFNKIKLKIKDENIISLILNFIK